MHKHRGQSSGPNVALKQQHYNCTQAVEQPQRNMYERRSPRFPPCCTSSIQTRKSPFPTVFPIMSNNTLLFRFILEKKCPKPEDVCDFATLSTLTGRNGFFINLSFFSHGAQQNNYFISAPRQESSHSATLSPGEA